MQSVLRSLALAYRRRYWDEREVKFPKCPFCGHQEFRLVRPMSVSNSRFSSEPRVRVGLTCVNCGARVTGTRSFTKNNWTYFDTL